MKKNREMRSVRVSEPSESHLDSISAPDSTIDAIRAFWEEYVYDDVKVAQHPIDTKDFFDELEAYRSERLEYLPRIVDFAAYKGKRVLEVGCRVGIDLVRFARHGADVTGIDLLDSCVESARTNFALHGLTGDLQTMNGEQLEFDDESFDMVYAHGVVQYTEDPERMIREIGRVLKPGGEAILMVYNRYSWLNVLSRVSGKNLEHEDSPVFKKYSISEFRRALSDFSQVRMIPERFPVRTRLHSGLKARLYYRVFVGLFNLIPRPIVRPFGSHIIGKAIR